VFPELTVVIPVWGAYWVYLDQLLPALHHQGIHPEQIIIVANGEAFPAELIDRGYICIRTSEQVDIGSARNAGLELVSTRYVLFCDADDLPVSGAISDMLAALEQHPKAVLATGFNMRADGEPYPWPDPSMPLLVHKRRRLMLRQWGWNQMFAAGGTVFRTRVLAAAGGFPSMELAEDGALIALLSAIGEIVFLDRPTRIYQIHPEGLCQQGHSRTRWRQAYRQQRIWLRRHDQLPWWLRKLTYVYAPMHRINSRHLERKARYDYGQLPGH